ncbi:hypothetical protein RJ639_011670 [Escallonia herrerae]|uniref:Uncharacterized protein n=1 Tax=Escallonia herrerae TaxID=1293975 RepID=A0AA88VJX6_9ASTE|nr:hypothetical protein RJ639_011670 [Escallonia herrerae]
MDRELGDMQALGIFGIYKEAYKIITSLKKLFTQITLAFILPLSIIFLAHVEVSTTIFWNIRFNVYGLPYIPDQRSLSRRHQYAAEWGIFLAFKFAYFTFLLIFSLLSTAAVTYTISSIYTGNDVTFKKVRGVVPKIWKRLVVTFLCTFLAFFAYHVVTAIILFLWVVTLSETVAGLPIFIIIVILYAIGFVYMTIVWQLASVVSVLETSSGIKAVKKSNNLIKGKMVAVVVTFFGLIVLVVGIQILFYAFVVYPTLGLWGFIAFAILSIFLITVFVLYGLAIQTIIYFVCKSYHNEIIERTILSKHLEVIHLGKYHAPDPAMAKGDQLEMSHV